MAHRTAWLLRVNRLYGRADEWTRGYAFARAFPGGSWPLPADPSRVSRWETARTDVPYGAVVRYEELLGLAPGLLTSAIDTVNRYVTPAPGPLLSRPGPDGGPPGQRTADLLDAVTSRTVVAAADWDDLTATLTARPGLWLRPGDWYTLCERLLTETVISDGTGWKQRFEAFSRLLHHPAAQRHAIAACADAAHVPDAQALVETVCLLDTSAHADAAHHVLAQLRDPVNDDAFHGALLACVRKLAHGHFTPEQAGAVSAVCADLLHDTSVRYDDARALAAVLLGSVAPEDLVPSAHAALRRGLPGTGGPPPVPADPWLVRRVADATVAALPREIPRFEDAVLPVLVREVLYAPVSDVRMHAALLLAATPYRAPLARALKTEVVRSPGTRLLLRLLTALRNLGADTERPWAERLVLHPLTPAPVAGAAAQALGHLGGRSDDTFWTAAIARHTPLPGSTNRAGVHVLRGLVYALGMSGDTVRLAGLAGSRAQPDEVRAPARWWGRVPAHLRFGAPDRPDGCPPD
ncbi:XRE family transcriptional regulator [Streptomyces sp. NPDC008150]|uniref:XRE family transcriptional regulator n=1 Tax=Streptomyces sp. NPDC008150 TaxID=3364816 RepID=UPI0036E1613B